MALSAKADMNWPDDYLIPGIEPYHVEDAGIIYCGDCKDILPHLPKVDLVLTDPPYGISLPKKSKNYGDCTSKSRKASTLNWDDKLINHECFVLIFKCSENQIVFGANYYWEEFYTSPCYIIWDKRGNLPDVPFSPTEFAWTSFQKMSKKYTIINHGFIKQSSDLRQHPTQKPSELFKAIVSDFSKLDNIILDPFLGSGTTAVAAKELGRRFIGIEISPEYCAIAKKRLRQGVMNFQEAPRAISQAL